MNSLVWLRQSTAATAQVGPSSWRWLLVLVIGMLHSGCEQKKPDFAAAFDKEVSTKWLPGSTQVEAIEFIEKGGLYNYDPEDSEDLADNYDQTFLLPLMKRLRDETGLTLIALTRPEEPNVTFAVIAALPEDEATHTKIHAIFKESEAAFGGAIFDQWGHSWLGIDYYNPEDMTGEHGEFMKKNFSR